MNYEQQIERLIKISNNHPIVSDNFIPWQMMKDADKVYLTESLVSLYGLPEYDTLSKFQKVELGRYEVGQVMYSYAFGEIMLCLFLSRFIVNIDNQSVEYRYVLKMLIEECHHQEMFAKALQKIDVKPLPIPKFHKFLGTTFAKYLSVNHAFLSSLTIEMIADRYGDILRKDDSVYPLIKKVSELHNIEEARHILYTKLFLDTRIKKAGFFERSFYSCTILLSVWFMRSMYVKKELYQRLVIPNANQLYKKAVKNYKQRFSESCLTDLIPFVKEINGLNWLTKWLWRTTLKIKL